MRLDWTSLFPYYDSEGATQPFRLGIQSMPQCAKPTTEALTPDDTLTLRKLLPLASPNRNEELGNRVSDLDGHLEEKGLRLPKSAFGPVLLPPSSGHPRGNYQKSTCTQHGFSMSHSRSGMPPRARHLAGASNPPAEAPGH